MTQLGSPHGRGSGQPRPPKLTWRDGWNGCAEAGCWLVSIPIALLGIGLGLIGFYVGVDVFVTWLMSIDVLATLLLATFAALFIGIAVAGLVGMIRGRAPSGTSAPNSAMAVAVLILFGLMGLGMLYGAITYQPAAPTF